MANTFNKSLPNNTFNNSSDFGRFNNTSPKVNRNLYGWEREEEEVFTVNAKPWGRIAEEPEVRANKHGGPLSVVSGMEYNEDEDYTNVIECQDSIDLVTDSQAIDLSKENTIATALKFSHFYIAWEVDPRKRNVFRFKIVKSKTMAMFLGI